MSDPTMREIEPFVELGHFEIHAPTVRLLAYKFCLQNYCVALGRAPRDLPTPVTVAMLDPADGELLGKLAIQLQRPVTPVRLNAYEIRKALDIGYGLAVAERHKFNVTLKPVREISFDPGRRVDDVLSDVLGRAITLGASDVHIEAYEDDVDVRIRIDGMLHQIISPISIQTLPSVISRLKILSDLDIAEKRSAQDGRVFATFTVDGVARTVDFRLSIVPGPFGEDAVLRILDSAKPMIGLEKLGFADETLAVWRTLIQNPEGMLLVTGPTGSGKTTTLYSALQELNTDENKVLTVEDPIEYLFAKINQKQIGPRMSFAEYARSFLRQDPDVMMIGEIRDPETADIALQAAMTGHLVLSTLHTNDSVSTIGRLLTLGLPERLIADSLLAVLSQRLMRRVCPECVRPIEPKPTDRLHFERLGVEFPLVAGEGCAHCRQTGYSGRIGIYELFVVDDAIAEQIAAGAALHEVRAAARGKGMRSLYDDAVEKVRRGLTTFDEVTRRVPHKILTEKR
ncbi:MAG: type II/IV secretion system protein [Myxococcales bacterium]|nr:type II/IV secretion system protein [Myxococcales bacterium]